MSAEILRRAAEAVRDEWAGETTGPFKNAAQIHLAVADLLDATAAEHESDSGHPTVDAFFASLDTAPDLAALAVARAYLGEQS